MANVDLLDILGVKTSTTVADYDYSTDGTDANFSIDYNYVVVGKVAGAFSFDGIDYTAGNLVAFQLAESGDDYVWTAITPGTTEGEYLTISNDDMVTLLTTDTARWVNLTGDSNVYRLTDTQYETFLSKVDAYGSKVAGWAAVGEITAGYIAKVNTLGTENI